MKVVVASPTTPTTPTPLTPRHVLGITDLSAADLSTVIRSDERRRNSLAGRTLWALDDIPGQPIVGAARNAANRLGTHFEQVGWRRLWSASRRLPTPHGQPLVAAIVAAGDGPYVEWVASRLAIPVIAAAPLDASAPTLVAAAMQMVEHLGPLTDHGIDLVGARPASEGQWIALAALIGLHIRRSAPAVIVNFVDGAVHPGGAQHVTLTFPASGALTFPGEHMSNALGALVDFLAAR